MRGGRSQTTRFRGNVVALFEQYWKILGGPELEQEVRFAPPRRYRFDYAHADSRLAIELEGGVTKQGWHQSIERMISDARKYNLAGLLGWTVIRYTVIQLEEDPVGEIQPVITLIQDRLRATGE